MKPAGQVGSVRTLPSTLIKRCITILVTSAPFKAYFRRFLKKIIKGNDSRNLCGPVEGRGANTPPNLSNIQALGAAKRFKCFLGPRAQTPKRETQKINIIIWTHTHRLYKRSLLNIIQNLFSVKNYTAILSRSSSGGFMNFKKFAFLLRLLYSILFMISLCTKSNFLFVFITSRLSCKFLQLIWKYLHFPLAHFTRHTFILIFFYISFVFVGMAMNF